jgi:signal transduction histidine kinase/CheY-like chemotaxis protein
VHGQVLGVVAAEGAVPRWVYVYAFAETRQAAELHRVVVSFIDVTERVQAESDLKQYKDRLEDEVQQRTADLVLARNAAEAASQAKSAFLANMSHELRTPLNAILGFSDMIGQSPSLPDGMRQSINIVSRSGEHLLALINDVLEVAKIEAGRVELENAAFDLGALVRGVTDMMQVRALEKGLELRIEQSPDFPRYIVGDQARLRQVLINLIGNAVKFTRQGGVIVRLGAGKDRLSEIWIEVEDTGPGMAPELQQQVFEPFVQLGEQGINNGTGLGLTITRQFVKLMGGRIGLESSPGKGSLFRVDLPVKRATESDIAPAPLAEKSEPARLAPGQPSFRILIVEDQRDNQLLLSLLMEAVGYEVKVADNGQRGVELFESWRPHLIWMDRRMPGMDGMEATRRIRGLPGGKEVRIVAVTASAFAEERAEMVEAGMDDFVRKPYRSGEIYACLARQLGVQFVAEGARETADAALAPEQLEILPEALRAELRRALESLKGDEIAVVIRRVGEYDPRLQEVLARFAAEFNYPAILGALRKMIESA